MKIKTVYQCTSCGYQSPKWAGKCPDCGEWNTLAETAQVKGGAKAAKAAPKQPVSRLSEVETGSDQRLLTGIAEFDRVMGGGIVRDSVTIITSPPGGGKSTLSLMAASALAFECFMHRGRRVTVRLKTVQTVFWTPLRKISGLWRTPLWTTYWTRFGKLTPI